MDNVGKDQASKMNSVSLFWKRDQYFLSCANSDRYHCATFQVKKTKGTYGKACGVLKSEPYLI